MCKDISEYVKEFVTNVDRYTKFIDTLSQGF